MRMISDPEKALTRAKQYWFSDADFWSCVDLSIGRLQERLSEVAKVRGKGLERKFDEAFGKFVTFTQYGPELEKIRKKKGELEDEPTPDPDRLASDSN